MTVAFFSFVEPVSQQLDECLILGELGPVRCIVLRKSLITFCFSAAAAAPLGGALFSLLPLYPWPRPSPLASFEPTYLDGGFMGGTARTPGVVCDARSVATTTVERQQRPKIV